MVNGGPATRRWLEVSPERVGTWLEEFTVRHGATVTTIDASRSVVSLRAADGACAECHVPFPPLSAPTPFAVQSAAPAPISPPSVRPAAIGAGDRRARALEGPQPSAKPSES